MGLPEGGTIEVFLCWGCTPLGSASAHTRPRPTVLTGGHLASERLSRQDGSREAGHWPAREKVVHTDPAFPSQAPCHWDLLISCLAGAPDRWPFRLRFSGPGRHMETIYSDFLVTQMRKHLSSRNRGGPRTRTRTQDCQLPVYQCFTKFRDDSTQLLEKEGGPALSKVHS